MTTEYRIQQLELDYEELKDRVVELEQQVRGAHGRRPAPRAGPASPAAGRPRRRHRRRCGGFSRRRPSRSRRPARQPRKQPALNFEDLLGGRIFALIGAVAVVLAGAFFFALAVSNGWIGEAARTVMAGGRLDRAARVRRVAARAQGQDVRVPLGHRRRACVSRS